MMQSNGVHGLSQVQMGQDRYNTANQGQASQSQNPELQNQAQQPDAYSKDEVQYLGQQNQQIGQKGGASSFMNAPLHTGHQHSKSQSHAGQHIRPLAPTALDSHQSLFNGIRNNSANSATPSPSALVKESHTSQHAQIKGMQMQQERAALPPNVQAQGSLNSAYQASNFAAKQKVYGNQGTQPGDGGSLLAASGGANGGAQHDYHEGIGQGIHQQQYLMGMQMAARQGQAQGGLEQDHGGRYHLKPQSGRMLMPEQKGFVSQPQDSDLDGERVPSQAQGGHKKNGGFMSGGSKVSQQVVGGNGQNMAQGASQFHKYAVGGSGDRIDEIQAEKRIQQHDSLKGLDDQGPQSFMPQQNPSSPLLFHLSHTGGGGQAHLAAQSQTQQTANGNQNNLMQGKAGQILTGNGVGGQQLYNIKKCSVSQVQYGAGGVLMKHQMDKGSGSLIGRPDEQVKGLSSLDHQNQPQYGGVGGAGGQKSQATLLHSFKMDQMLHEQIHGREAGQFLYTQGGVEPDESLADREAMISRLRQGIGSQLMNSDEHLNGQQYAVNPSNLAAVHQQQYLMLAQQNAGSLAAANSQNGHSGGQQRQQYQGSNSQALSGTQSKVAAQKMLSQQTRQGRNGNGAKAQSAAQHVGVDVVSGLGGASHQDMVYHQAAGLQQPANQHRLVASAMNQSSYQMGGVGALGMGGGAAGPSGALSPLRATDMFGGVDSQIIPGPGSFQFYQLLLRNAMNPSDVPGLADHEYETAGNLVDHPPQMQLFDSGHMHPSIRQTSVFCHRTVGGGSGVQQPQSQLLLSQGAGRGALGASSSQHHPLQSQLQRFPPGVEGAGPAPLGDALSPLNQCGPLGKSQSPRLNPKISQDNAAAALYNPNVKELQSLASCRQNYYMQAQQYGRQPAANAGSQQQMMGAGAGGGPGGASGPAGGQDHGGQAALLAAAHSQQSKQSMKLMGLCKGDMHQAQSQVPGVGNNQVVQAMDCNQYQALGGGAGNVMAGCPGDAHPPQGHGLGPKQHVAQPVVGQMGGAQAIVSSASAIRETVRVSDRFEVKQKLGQGTFSFIYQAYDSSLRKDVALKVEKKDKNKSILIFEYNVLQSLKGLKHVCDAHEFVKNSEQNLIVMDLLGANLAKVRKVLESNYSLKIAVQLVIEMLAAIEEVHNRGYIHRDVKASNFVLSQDYRKVFIVDFGLAKKHLDSSQRPVKQRKTADFRGTVSFASLNAHNNIDLSRRDDLWSLYFVILDFLEEKLEWREKKEYTMDEVKAIKHKCLQDPEKHLWHKTKDNQAVKNIFRRINGLQYADKPDYEGIRQELLSIYERTQTIYPQPQLKHQNPAEMGLAPYTSSSSQLVRYGANQKAYNIAPAAAGQMYPHMILDAGEPNLNGMLHVMPTHNLSPRGGILPGQRSDLPYDDAPAQGHHPAHSHHGLPQSQRAPPPHHHQYPYPDTLQDWYGAGATAGATTGSKHQQAPNVAFDPLAPVPRGLTATSAASTAGVTAGNILHQDDYQKEKMFSEFFTQVLPPPPPQVGAGGGGGAPGATGGPVGNGPAASGNGGVLGGGPGGAGGGGPGGVSGVGAGQAQGAGQSQQAQGVVGGDGQGQMKSVYGARMKSQQAAQYLGQAQNQAQVMGGGFGGQSMAQSVLKAQGGQQVAVSGAGGKLCNQDAAQAQSQQNLMYPLQLQRKPCKRPQGMGNGLQAHHMSQQQMMQATNMQAALGGDDVPLQQQVATGQIHAMQNQQTQAALQQSNGGGLHHMNMPQMGIDAASPGHLPMCVQVGDQKQQVYPGGMQAQQASNYGEQHDVLGPSPDVNQGPNGYLQLEQQQIPSGAEPGVLYRMPGAPLTSEFYDGIDENKALRQLGMGGGPQGNEEKYLKRSFTQQAAMAGQQAPLDAQNLLMQNLPQPQDAPSNGRDGQAVIPLQSLAPQGQAYNQQAIPARPKARKRDHKNGEKSQQQAGQRNNGANAAIHHIESNGSSPGAPRKIQKLADQMSGTGLPTTGGCDLGNAEGASGLKKGQLEDQLGRPIPGNGRGPQHRLVTDGGPGMSAQRQKQLQGKLPAKELQHEVKQGSQHLQHINFNQNIYVAQQPFLLLPQQNSEAYKLTGIIAAQHHGGHGLSGLLGQQAQEQQIAAQHDHMLGTTKEQEVASVRGMIPNQANAAAHLSGQQAKGSSLRNDQQAVTLAALRQNQLDAQGGIQHPYSYGGQHLYDLSALKGYQLSNDAAGFGTGQRAAEYRAQFLRKVYSLYQWSYGRLNVGATALLQQRGASGAASSAKGPPTCQLPSDQLLQMEIEGKVSLNEIDFRKLKPIQYPYQPELFEATENPQLKKQVQAFARQKARGAGRAQGGLPPPMKTDVQLFRVEKVDPRQASLVRDQVQPYASRQKDGYHDKLTFSIFDYICHSYEQNLQDQLGQSQSQEQAGAGGTAQQMTGGAAFGKGGMQGHGG